MNKSSADITDKIIFLISFFIGAFLLFIYLDYRFFKLDFVLVGVFRELLTIPSFLAQPVILFFGIRGLVLNKFNVLSLPMYSTLIMMATLTTTIASFFF